MGLSLFGKGPQKGPARLGPQSARTSKVSPANGPAQHMIAIHGTKVPLTIKRHPRSQSISLRIDAAKRGLLVTMPHWVPEKDALDFVSSRSDWVERRLAALGPEEAIQDGSKVFFRDERYQICWSATLPRTPVLKDGQLQLGGEKDLIGRRIERWLKKQARIILTDDLSHYCYRAGVDSLPRIGLSNARRRWGSCSQSGWVRIQWRLVMAPDMVRRAVVAHEVAHLKHMDHSPRFYNWLDTIFEEDRHSADAWLKAHGNRLHGIGFCSD